MGRGPWPATSTTVDESLPMQWTYSDACEYLRLFWNILYRNKTVYKQEYSTQ